MLQDKKFVKSDKAESFYIFKRDYTQESLY